VTVIHKAMKRKLSNPLALAVLVLLFERPMHPYEMAATLRERRQEESIKLRYGSLYTVIELLQREGFIVPRETLRDGRRPERTVYALTSAGRAEMRDWLRELLSTPVKEYPQFVAGLSLLGALAPEEATALLEERVHRLEQQIRELRATLDVLYRERGLEPLVLVEAEYRVAMLDAERQFVDTLVRRIKAEGWGPVETWKAWHAAARARPMA
jgi:DNA-binding PadR family transcriptional regulator